MIVASEVVHTGEVHLEFNSCFLKIISQIFPDEKIVYRSEEQHAAAMAQQLQGSSIRFEPFPAYYDRRAYSWPKRIFGEMKTIYHSLRYGKKQQAAKYVWTCLFPTGHLFLVLLLKFFRSDRQHIIVLHGELELLKVSGKRRSERFLGQILRYAMKYSPCCVRYIVLGDSILQNLRPHLSPAVLSKVISIIHPYNYSGSAVTRSIPNTQPIKFGTIGTQMLVKNSHYLFELTSAFESDIQAGKLSFESIGQVLSELEPYSNALVDAKYSRDFVPQEQFEKAVETLDFVLFFYDNQSYELCASGAVFEAIKRGVPIISIRNDYFTWLFNAYGAMGILGYDLNDIKCIISKIVDGDMTTEISSILTNITAFRKENDLGKIASDLSKKL